MPRPAATIVVARPAPPHLEFLLLQRPMESRFAAGAYVFPGGVIEADDASPTWAGRLPPVGEATACVAALRELFEETGILPASTRPGDASGLAEARRALLADQTRFSRLAERLHFDFSSESIAYFARWITPTNLALRFDTRFFLLPVLDPLGPISLTAEHDRALWVTPDDALRGFTAGRLPMLFPTMKTIERLAGFASLEAALDGLGDVAVEPVLVKLRAGGSGVRPLAPGAPGYDELP